jgi:Fe-S cluster biosynthesis and repair protein YggX
VLQFRNEPFVTNQPVLLRVNNAGDWAGLPVYSGSPSNLTVRAEQFISATQGLGAPNSVSLGRAHASARFAIANQYSNAISLYSLTPPRGDVLAEVAITPPGGSYSAAVEFRFTCSDAAAKIYYRIGTTEWANWTNGQTVPLITNATVQYYAQSATNLDKTAVHAAVFTFTQNPSEMDTKGDGIPDYVKLACGLSLTGTADADGDGFSDFEELVNGTDPLAATNSPALTNHIDDQAVFNIVSTPAAWDGFRGRTTNVVTNTTLKVYDLQGSLLRSGGVATNTWPAARLTNITIINEDRLVVLATDPHYTIITTNNDKRIGREMLAMVVVPELKATNINYTYAGGSMVAAANQWVLAASNAMRHVTRGTVTNAMSPDQTLIALLCEKKIAQCLGGRGQVWWTNMTLFPNRPVDLTRTNPAQELLLSIESETNSSPGYRLKSIYQSISNNIYTATVSSKVTNLQAVIRDIYTVSGRYNNSNPATYLSPVDEIRYFLWNGIVDTNYSTKMSTTNLFSNAVVAVNAVLTNVPSRIFTNLIMTIRADTLTNDCRLVNAANGGVYSLIDQSGIPFGLPDGFNLLVGTKVLVGGYIEPLDSICGYPQFEVTAMILDTLPAASDNDSGNLLVDTWERQFFGSVGGHSAFADDDGDGYSNLQEMLEGSDPSDPLGVPAVGIKTFGKPDVELLPNGTGLRLQWNWPWIYKDHFQFGFRQMDNLTGSYSEAVVSTYLAGETDKLYADIAGGGGSQKFYLLTINLK